jgi:deoxyribonuclease V
MNLTLHHAHPWKLSPAEAITLQQQLAPQVIETPWVRPPKTVAGLDMSVRGDEVRAAVVVLQLPDLKISEQAVWHGRVEFPYVPGLLSFREAPAVLRALERLSALPDLLMADAQGRAHPRRFGLACHLGVLLDWPTIGVAKSRLYGVHDPLPAERGASSPLRAGREVLGVALRTRTGSNPVYVSIGHRATLAQAVELVLACAPRYRIPEPTRQAHLLSKQTDNQSTSSHGTKE